MNKTFTTAALSTLLLIAGCSDTQMEDVHAAPREIQAWENVDLSGYDKTQLLAHLDLLATETTSAAAAGEAIEFHHLEVAISATLKQLEPLAAGKDDALQTIETLKELAIKLHLAGHDGNIGMGTKLATAITSQSARLASQI